MTSDLGSSVQKVQNNVQTSWNHNPVPSLPPKKKILLKLARESLKIEI